MPVLAAFRRAWNAFTNPTPQPQDISYGTVTTHSGGSGPNRIRLSAHSERSIISSIYARLSIDVANILIKHAKVDDQNRYTDDVDSFLNACLTLEPNLDQGPRAFRQDIVITMFDRGVAAIVPIDTIEKPDEDGFTDILTMRVGDIVEWLPRHIRVSLYNEAKGMREDVLVPKKFCAIVENPLYAVMNEPNSTLRRLVRKLTLLDSVDEISGSGRLDVIIQLPYTVKSESRIQQAERRRQDIELQLSGSQYGIAYVDGTEKITQLNRPAENNLLKQVEYLTALLYNQLGLTEEVMNGTADEAAMINYYNRTIMPIVEAIVEAMQRSFIGGSGLKRGESIKHFRNPFQFTTAEHLAEIADKFTRNEIMTANEIRSVIGLPPSTDPKADKLQNSNMPQPDPTSELTDVERNRQNGSGSRLQRVGD